MSGEISLEQALQAPIYFLFLEDCVSCEAYKQLAVKYNIPYYITTDIYDAPLQAVEADGKIYSPALWKGEHRVISPSEEVIKIMAAQAKQNSKEEE